MKLLVYTCVIGGYDRVYPPIVQSAEADYVIVTDDPDVNVQGWTTYTIDPAGFGSPSLANRYHKMLMHHVLPDYDVSVYVDGNIRLLGNMIEFVARNHSCKNALTVFRHDRRNSVQSEIETCEALGKLPDSSLARARLNHFLEEGFPDDLGLIEAGILIKEHRHAQTDRVMSAWWAEYAAAPTRDQLSLPYALWKSKAIIGYHDFSFRDPNLWFGIYPHRGTSDMTPAYADLCARAYDSPLHRLALRAWNAVRTVRRKMRALRA